MRWCYDSRVSVAVWRFIPAFGVDSQFTDTVKFESKDTFVILKWADWRSLWFVIWNCWWLTKWYATCWFARCHGLHDANGVRMHLLLAGFKGIVYWWFIAITTGNWDENGVRCATITKENSFPFACSTAKSAVVHWIIKYRQTDTSLFRFWIITEQSDYRSWCSGAEQVC
jgi:hypothetical protein